MLLIPYSKSFSLNISLGICITVLFISYAKAPTELTTVMQSGRAADVAAVTAVTAVTAVGAVAQVSPAAGIGWV